MATRSLGTLTLDLVAKVGGFERGMDKAERRSARWSKKTKTQFADVSKSAALMAAGIAAGLVAVTKNTIDSGREIQNLSRLANTATGDFQRIAYAAKQFGVDQDKVADILKDTTDKVGDFLQTGGGPLADFFENIAPQVGVTIDQFKNLSGSQALGLYVDSLEKANLSQSEMTFYMEAIASDASRLLPLLKDNGKELNKLSKEADGFGVVISDIDLAALEEVDRETQKAAAAFKGLQTQVAISTLPAIQEMAEFMSDPETIRAATELAHVIIDGMRLAAQFIRDTVNVTRFLGEEMAAIVNGAAVGDLVRLQDQLEEFMEVRNRLISSNPPGLAPQGELDRIDARIAKLKKDIELTKELMDLRGARTADIPAPPKPGDIPGIAQPPAISAGRASKDPALKIVEGLRTDYEKYLDDVAAITQSVALSNDEKSKTLKLLSDGFADTLLIDESMLKERENVILDSINSQAEQIRDSLRTEEEAIKESYQRRRDIILNNTQYTGEAQTELLRRLEEERSEGLLEIERRKNAEIAEGYQVLLDVIGSYYEGMEGQQAAYARGALSIASVLLDEEKRSALGKIIANTESAAMKAYEAMAGIPVVGPALGAAAAATVTVAGAAAASRVIGIAHDGLDSVPTTGTYILEKGERVVTEKTSAKLDRKLDTVGNGQAQPLVVRMNNILDPKFVGDYMSGPEGDVVLDNYIDRNQTKIQSIAKS